jgi:hypothetical protein
MGLSGIDLNFNYLHDEGGNCLVCVGSGTGGFCFDDSELATQPRFGRSFWGLLKVHAALEFLDCKNADKVRGRLNK